MADTCESNSICQTYIILSLYKDKSVFYTYWVGALCDPIFNVFLLDCMGDTIKEYKFGDQHIFEEEVEFVEHLYTCSYN